MNDPHDNRQDDDAILRRLQAAEAEDIRLTDISAAQAIARGRRWAYWVPAEPWKKTGKWVPSVIVEDVAGHTPMAGNGTCAQPWFWGTSYPEARDHCTRVNAELGITMEDMVAVLFSSMRARRREESRA